MGQNISLTASDGHHLSAYEAGKADDRYALVVLQEIFGVNHHIRSVCDRFSAQGYHVIAPALFDRVKGNIQLDYDKEGIKTGIEIRSLIESEKTLLDIIAAAKFLKAKKVGIVGYCWGGSLSWRAATQTDIFSAASCWYGAQIPQLKDAKANCPVQMHFGGRDESIPLKEVEKIRASQPNAEIYIYENANHGFGCAERSDYNEIAYKLAQHRTLEFFKKYL